MMRVVERDKRGVLDAEVVESGEDLGAKEALVPDVVEVFDDPVVSRFAQRDEPGSDAEIQACRDDRPEVLVRGWDRDRRVEASAMHRRKMEAESVGGRCHRPRVRTRIPDVTPAAAG